MSTFYTYPYCNQIAILLVNLRLHFWWLKNYFLSLWDKAYTKILCSADAANCVHSSHERRRTEKSTKIIRLRCDQCQVIDRHVFVRAEPELPTKGWQRYCCSLSLNFVDDIRASFQWAFVSHSFAIRHNNPYAQRDCLEDEMLNTATTLAFNLIHYKLDYWLTFKSGY